MRDWLLDGLAAVIARALDIGEALWRWRVGFALAGIFVLSTGAVLAVVSEGNLTPWRLPSLWTPVPASLDAAAPAETTDPSLPAPSVAKAPPEPQAPVGMDTVLTVADGDTLAGMLGDVGVDATQAYYAIKALREVYDPRSIRPNMDLKVTYIPAEGDGGKAVLLSLGLAPDRGRRVTVAKGEDGKFTATEKETPRTKRLILAEGAIESSLFEAAVEAAVPDAILATTIRALSYDIDFQREIRQGDRFSVLYESFEGPNGEEIASGRIHHIAMIRGEKVLKIYGHEDQGFYDAEGRSVVKALLRTPIDGARLSSGFGKRKHPILGYTKMHQGVDFAAPKGTPIFAAGDGRIVMARTNGAYGKYVRINHENGYSTAYAHMSAWAKGVKEGQRIKQGQVIGYVGTTGRSTGNHLHYEILRSGKQLNPLKVKTAGGRVLEGGELARFKKARDAADAELATLQSGGDVALVN